MSVIKRGDPYVLEVSATVSAVMGRLGHANLYRFSLHKMSLRLLPVVPQLYWGYCVKATASFTLSSFIRLAVSSAKGCA
jgi:hypothetical protein